MKQKILIGSRAFFGGIGGFKSENRNMLELHSNPAFKLGSEQDTRKTRVYKYTREPAQVMIKRAVESGNALQAGKFLVPEVARAIGAQVQDLKPLEPLFAQLPEKHKWQQDVYAAYMTNGDFRLTAEQRQAAYEVYRAARTEDGKEVQS